MRSVLRFRGLVVLVGSLAAGCADESIPAAEQAGGVELALQVAPGLDLDSLSYTVTGPGGFNRSGSVNLGKSASIGFTVGGLPAGNGYTITVTGTASDGATTCGGTATFNVMARATTTVMLNLRCREPAKNGSVKVVGKLNVCPVIDALSAAPSEAEVGGVMALSGAAHDSDGAPSPISFQWTGTGGTLVGAGATATLTCTGPGPVTVTLSVTDGDCSDSATVALLCTLPAVKINEIESSQGVPGDWVELVNTGTSLADVSGWVFKDSDDSHSFAIPAGTTIPPGGFLVLEEAAFGFGLGSADAARIFTPGAVFLVDAHSWTAHAATTYGRCPDGSGGFVTSAAVTKGAANACGSPADAGAPDLSADLAPDQSPDASSDLAAIAVEPWPGPNNVVTADELNQFGDNLSGLTYEP
ncbi:MAG TPA: lamin tail domain-containing protein, partial [Acidimicrobiales bacterium]|nr:lamin tail domain-containing protein [Acidimicrobiales bacterium]